MFTPLVCFFVSGVKSKADVEKIAESLYNPVIERVHIKSFAAFSKDRGMDVVVPKVNLGTKPKVQKVDLEVSDDELTKIGKEGIVGPDGNRNGPLALPLDYMLAIQAYFREQGRAPTDIELESLAQTWSEHCKHTIFADQIDSIKEGLYKKYIKGATEEIRAAKGKKDFCVSVFSDNSGAIDFDDKHMNTHKAETHNSPSALDPFGGAITGIVGVNRDTMGFGLGAKPVANMYGYCFADPRDETRLFKGRKQTQEVLSARRIMEGVVAGVNAGGNQSGIPTPQGFMTFDRRYRGKPLVFVGTVGIAPRRSAGRLTHKKSAKPGDYIVVLGRSGWP